jgi:hypothetical protein
MRKGGPSASSEIHADVVGEGRRLLDAARAQSIPLRLLGGVAIRLRSSGLPEALEREYKDLDLATTSRGRGVVSDLLKSAGYEPHVAFNAMNSKERMLFFDNAHARQVDVFVGSFRMCHEIPLEQRLEVDETSVPLAELLLTKLQIIELNEKDVRDTVAMLLEHPLGESDGMTVNAPQVARLCGEDWGLWRTITANLDAVRRQASRYDVDHAAVEQRLAELLERIEAEPKSRGWRLRAKIGERKRWYELPEEV